jgi:hypothetical protein
MATRTTVDVDELLGHIKNKYSEVVSTPGKEFEFHTRRDLVDMLGTELLDALPEDVVAAFAGAGNPFSVGTIEPVDKILDLGSGGGFDCIIDRRLQIRGRRVHDSRDAGAGRCQREDTWTRPVGVQTRLHRGPPGGRRLGRCGHQQRRDQPGSGQGHRFSRSLSGSRAMPMDVASTRDLPPCCL